MTDPHDDVEERLVTGYAGRLSVVLALGWFVILVGRSAVPPLLPAITEELAISSARAGVALTLLMGLHSAIQYPAGRLADGLSRTTVIVAGLGVGAAGVALLSVVGSYPGFLAAVALVGLGSGFYFTPARALLSDLFVERRGEAFGLQTAAGLAGSTAAAGLAGLVLAVATWRAAFPPAAVLLVAVLVLLHIFSREPYVLARVRMDVRGTVARLVGMSALRRPVVALTLRGVAVQGIVGFLPTFLIAEKGFSEGFAGLSFALIFVVGFVAGPAAGNLSDRLSRTPVVVGALLVAVAGLAGLLAVSSVPGVLVAVAVVSGGLWAFAPVMQAHIMDLLAAETSGSDFGALKTVYTGIGSVGPTYVGVVAGWAGYTVAFAGLIACLLAAAVVMVAPWP